jgi:hypothetical protein
MTTAKQKAAARGCKEDSDLETPPEKDKASIGQGGRQGSKGC